MSDYLTVAECADTLACSTDSILRAIKRGDLPAVQYGRLVRVARSDFEAFLMERRRPSASPRRGARGR
jgi:excisionase family DNA binding protein